jgi:hypothetical protein
VPWLAGIYHVMSFIRFASHSSPSTAACYDDQSIGGVWSGRCRRSTEFSVSAPLTSLGSDGRGLGRRGQPGVRLNHLALRATDGVRA